MSAVAPIRTAPYSLEFLREIDFVQVRLEFQALDEVVLPPFPGSALRGVMGHALRTALCNRSGECETGCSDPAACSYFRLCERDRDCEGGNLPKSVILDPPVPEELARIAAGGPVMPPYRVSSRRGETSRLSNECGNLIPAGDSFRAGLTLLGQAGALLPIIIEVLSLATMRIGRERFVLFRVIDTGLGGRILWSRQERSIQNAMRQSLAPLLENGESIDHLSVLFICPVRLKTIGGYSFSGQMLAKHFWESALVRAMRVRDTFCAAGKNRLPWMNVPEGWAAKTIRMFHYELPRLSNRQQAFMEFDGLIGRVEYKGSLAPLVPLAYAAEILHIGQKATFGLGRIRCVAQRERS